MDDALKAGSPAWDNRGNYLTPDAAALIERLKQGRLVRASEPLTIEGHGFGWTGEVREMAHPDAIEAAAIIEAQARRIAELTEVAEDALSYIIGDITGAAQHNGIVAALRAVTASPPLPDTAQPKGESE